MRPFHGSIPPPIEQEKEVPVLLPDYVLLLRMDCCFFCTPPPDVHTLMMMSTPVHPPSDSL